MSEFAFSAILARMDHAIYHRLRLPLAVMMGCWLFVFAAQAETVFARAKQAFDAQDYDAALALFQPLAQKGSADAQYYSARIYEMQHDKLMSKLLSQNKSRYQAQQDENIRKLKNAERRWYEEAARQGHADAQYRLSRYIKLRPEKNKWRFAAAMQGHELAIAELGGSNLIGGLGDNKMGDWPLRERGEEEQKIYERVRFYLALAQSHVRGINILINDHRAFPQDYDKAMHYFRLAAGQGAADAQYVMGNILYYGYSKIGRDYHNKVWAKTNVQEAYQWYRKAAYQGQQYAQFELANMYEQGHGTTQDYAYAHMWLHLILSDPWQLPYNPYGDPPDSPVLERLDELTPKMTQQQLDYALKLSKKCAYKKEQSAPCEQDLDQAVTAYQGKDYAAAFTRFQGMAEQGDVRAGFYLARLYEQGLGHEIDYAQALAWYQFAAEHEDIRAQMRLAKNYDQGIHVTQNHTQAFLWYQRAAENGNKKAQSHLGRMYINASGVTYDAIYAAMWLEIAADGKNQLLQDLRDYALKQLSDSDKDKVMLLVARCRAQKYHSCDIDEEEAIKAYQKYDYPLAVQGFQFLARKGEAESQFYLGESYRQAYGVDKDEAQAFLWYEKAAVQGHVMAQYRLGNAYQHGLGITRDEAQSLDWYQQAADAGNGAAEIALVLSQGKKLEEADQQSYYQQAQNSDDKMLAQSILEQLAQHDYAQAQYTLSHLYIRDYNDKKEQSLRWLTESAMQNYHKAQYRLAFAYETGLYGVQDREEAIKWYKKAAQHQDFWAMRKLGELYASQQKNRNNDQAYAYMWFSLASEGGLDTEEMRDSLRETMDTRHIKRAERLIKKCRNSDYKKC